MAYIYGQRNQVQMFPSSIEEYIFSDDPVRVYDAFVEQLDLAGLGISLDEDQVGPPEYDPRAMLKLLVYGYSYGIRSSRKLERALYHNLSFIWLLGGLKPDHKTISGFRRDNLDALKKILRQCARLCLRLDLIDGNVLFVDGTKIGANASLTRTLSRSDALKLLEKADRRIEEILSEAEAVDQAEGKSPSLVHLQDELADVRRLRDKVGDVLKEIDESDRKVINMTDPECCHIQRGRVFMAGYNMQAVVDDKNGLIVQAEVNDKVVDVKQFRAQVDEANKTLGQKCQTACADAGYASTEDLKAVREQGINVIVPSQDQARHKEPGPFDRSKFNYDKEHDCYICPEGQRLSYRKTDYQAKSRCYQISRASICHVCRYYGECTRAKDGRAIVKLLDQESKEYFEANYAKPESQLIYRRRKDRVEHPFGHIKYNMGAKSFLLRGLKGAGGEAGLLATCFNLTRAINILGAEKLVQAWS